jgi:hypothetical protein
MPSASGDGARAQQNAVPRQLAAKGSCPDIRTVAPAPTRAAGEPVLNRQGQAVLGHHLGNQVFPGFGGEPMRMALAQVCTD